MACLRDNLTILCDGTKTYLELATALGKSKCYIEELVREMKLPRPKRDVSNVRKRSTEALEIIDSIKLMCDGKTSSLEISKALACRQKYVQRIMKEFDLPRLPPVSPTGARNFSFAGGRRIDQDGYVFVTAPVDHPYAKTLKGKKIPRIFEHRLVAEKKIGRYLLPTEVVDHIDSITIHNHPDNLRVFASNSDHLKATISGKVPQWTEEGIEVLKLKPYLYEAHIPLQTYAIEKKQGVIRLRKILLAWLLLDKDSPYLLGTHRWLEKAGIIDLSRSNLEHHLLALSRL